MPSINKLQITQFRNIGQETMFPAHSVNIITGENGSGKSSILEAIHVLGLGRSFRNTQQTPLIQQGSRECTVFGVLDSGISLGASRSLDDQPQVRVNGDKATSSAELASHLPFQLLNSDAFRLLEGGPKTRRQFIDWGVFHVEHRFHQHWREFKRCLQQRNALLKKKAPRVQIIPWTEEFVRHAEIIDQQRKRYLDQFLPVLEVMLKELIHIENLSFSYYRGWGEEGLAEALDRNLERDTSIGHSGPGPQRADLKIKMGNQYADDILSRGQQKLLVSAMKLAQGAYLAETSSQRCMFLIDDLPAELDKANRIKVCKLLKQLGGQLFITGTHDQELLDTIQESGFTDTEYKLFHVKHGRICTADTEK
jgi:DNA replication and repair protein RecF